MEKKADTKREGKDGITVRGVYKCPCCDEMLEKDTFIRFGDPCVCGSGKQFIYCCLRKLMENKVIDHLEKK